MISKFSLGEFIAYGSPCFSCDCPILVNLYIDPVDVSVAPARLRLHIKSGQAKVDLKVSYTSVLQLSIDLKTNRISTTNTKKLATYLADKQLSLQIECNQCNSIIMSQVISFDLKNHFVRAIEMLNESMHINYHSDFYHVYTSYVSDVSIISGYNPLFRLETPLMPIGKFKNRYQLLDKIRLFSTFS